MVLKTFSVQEVVYNQFHEFCKSRGMSMSKQIEIFMESMIERDPKTKEEYLERLDKIRKQKSIQIGTLNDLKERYGVE